MRLLVDLVLLLHGAFALFTVAGGFLALRWRRLPWLHVPCALWGCAVELTGWICPLTLLENRLRAASGEGTYGGDFLAHYLSAALYPVGLTREVQIALGAGVIIANAVAYGLVVRARTHARTRRRQTVPPLHGRSGPVAR
jgi:Protein of Unknown function (DUF2784)